MGRARGRPRAAAIRTLERTLLAAAVFGAADFLNHECSALLSGSAGALLARPLGSHGVFVGPASILDGGRRRLEASHAQGVLDTTYQHLSHARPLRGGTAAAIGLGFDRTSNVRVVTAAHQVVPEASVYDVVLALALARRTADSWSWGCAVKGFHSRLHDTGSTGAAADLEVLWHPERVAPLRLLLSLRNAGYASAHVAQGGFTAARFVAAASYSLESVPGQRLSLGASAIRPLAPGEEVAAGAGIEFATRRGLAVRAGYRTGPYANGMALGLGLSGARVSLDYAYLPFEGLGASHRVSLAVSFR